MAGRREGTWKKGAEGGGGKGGGAGRKPPLNMPWPSAHEPLPFDNFEDLFPWFSPLSFVFLI